MISNGPMNTRRLYDELESCCREIPVLAGHSAAYTPLFSAWRNRTEAALEALFGASSEPIERFRAIYFTPLFLSCRLDKDVFPEAFRDGLEEAGRLLEELLDKEGIAIQHK